MERKTHKNYLRVIPGLGLLNISSANGTRRVMIDGKVSDGFGTIDGHFRDYGSKGPVQRTQPTKAQVFEMVFDRDYKPMDGATPVYMQPFEAMAGGADYGSLFLTESQMHHFTKFHRNVIDAYDKSMSIPFRSGDDEYVAYRDPRASSLWHVGQISRVYIWLAGNGHRVVLRKPKRQ